jgi:elongator complex protein 1
MRNLEILVHFQSVIT